MSILKEPFAAPSRIKAVVRYLRLLEGFKAQRETVETVLSPKNILETDKTGKPSRKMVKATIRECIKMGLLKESEDKTEVAINQQLNTADSALPLTLTHLLLNTPDNAENNDFAEILAWYLAQDFLIAPRNWPEAEKLLNEQIEDGLLGLNDVQFGQFKMWACYLGFAWQDSLSNSQILVSDPTEYLKWSLEERSAELENQSIPLDRFIYLLGQSCPVFETGKFREEIEEQVGRHQPNQISSITSVALGRLEAEGLIELTSLSDATVWTLLDGSKRRISHLTWLREKSQERAYGV